MSKVRPFKYNAVEKLTRSFDDKVEALLTVCYPHHEIHEGNFYTLEMVSVANAGQAVEILLTPPALPGKEFHCVWEFGTKGEGSLRILEGVTSVSGGTNVTPVNNNRNSSNTSVSTTTKIGIPAGAITYTGGTEIHAHYFGSGVVSGATNGRDSEIIIKSGVSTVFRLASEVASNELWLHVLWYEHTDQNVQEIN